MEVQTKLKEDSLAPRFGTWWKKIRPFWASGGFDPVYSFLRAQSQAGKQICPASMHTYRAFVETPFEELKCVIVCQDPYFKFVNGSPIASGVALDCSITARVQPSLQNFYSGLEKELFDGLNLNYVQDYDLSYLSAQGVLLLNAALTVEKDKPNSHMDIWEPFTKFLLQEVISTTGVPVLFVGKEASRFELLLAGTNPTYTLSHPASSAYTGRPWETEGVFTKINKNIWESNEETIMWLLVDPPF
jgi:uracil-DNA glycosylase